MVLADLSPNVPLDGRIHFKWKVSGTEEGTPSGTEKGTSYSLYYLRVISLIYNPSLSSHIQKERFVTNEALSPHTTVSLPIPDLEGRNLIHLVIYRPKDFPEQAFMPIDANLNPGSIENWVVYKTFSARVASAKNCAIQLELI